MKYILTLSLSGICLAMFVFVMQGAVSAEVDFGNLLNEQTDAGAPASKVEVLPAAKKVETKTIVAEAEAKKVVIIAEKKAMTKNEAIKRAVKGRSWEEAKPDVIKVLKDYSPKKGELGRDKAPVESRGYKAKVREVITEDEAVAIALKDTPGEMIGVKWKKGNYRVKVWSESEGAAYKIYIDPQSGKVVRRKRK